MSEERYYAARMLWVRDQETWEKYQEMAKLILARHKVQVEHCPSGGPNPNIRTGPNLGGQVRIPRRTLNVFLHPPPAPGGIIPPAVALTATQPGYTLHLNRLAALL